MNNSGLRFLLPYMKPYRRALLIGALYALISAGASAFSPFWLGMAIDSLTEGVDPTQLAIFAVGLIVLAVIVALFPLPAAHVDRAHRRRHYLSHEPGPLPASAALRPEDTPGLRDGRPAFARHQRLHLYLALLQRRLSDVHARPLPAAHRLRADGAVQPAACRHRHGHADRGHRLYR